MRATKEGNAPKIGKGGISKKKSLISLERKGGWQCWVDIYDGYVIKIPKTPSETKREVKRYLGWENKFIKERMERMTNKAILDRKESMQMLKESKIPRRFLAEIEFLENDKVKQKRVVSLKEYLEKTNYQELEKIVDKIGKLILETWKYGIHEKTFKIFSNFGVDGDKIVLIDAFELLQEKEKVLNQIKNKYWHKEGLFHRKIPGEVKEKIIPLLDEVITQQNLDKFWGIKK